MFDIGFLEIILIGGIALMVFGPERLPELARTLGRWIARLRRMVNTVKSDIERELQIDELEELRQLKRELDPRRANRWLAENRSEFERGLNEPVIDESDLKLDESAGQVTESDQDAELVSDNVEETNVEQADPGRSIWDHPGEDVDEGFDEDIADTEDDGDSVSTPPPNKSESSAS